MTEKTSPAARFNLSGLVPYTAVVMVAVSLLIPYVYALITGTADDSLAGLARFHSTAQSVFCADGLTVFGKILLVEVGVLFVLSAVGVVGGSRLGKTGKVLRQSAPTALVVLALVAIPFFIGWRTESSVCERGKAFFWESIFIDVFIISILAISYNLMFGFTGVVSFGHAAFFGMGAYMVGLLMKHLEWSWWLAVLGSLGIGILIALIKGFVGLRVKDLAFAMFTLAFAQVFFLLSANRLMVDITGAEDGFTFPVPDWLNTTKNRLFYYYLVLIILLLSFYLVKRLMNSPTGRAISAGYSNEERARMLGLNTFYFKLVAIVMSGAMATIAGILRGISAKGASPNLLGLGFTIDPLVMTIIGGQGTFLGPVVGAFSLHLIEHFLRDTVLTLGTLEVNIGASWALILGIVFIVTVLVFPQGLVGTFQVRRLHTLEGWKKLLSGDK